MVSTPTGPRHHGYARERWGASISHTSGPSESVREEEERALQDEVKAFRAKLRRINGETAHEVTWYVAYSKWLDGFQEFWDVLQATNGSLAKTWEKVQFNVKVRSVMREMNLPHEPESLITMCRSEEFEAFRRDAEFAKCLSAQKFAFELLPQAMARTMAREHRFWEVRRRHFSLDKHEARVMKQVFDSVDVDEMDLEVAMAAAAGLAGMGTDAPPETTEPGTSFEGPGEQEPDFVPDLEGDKP